MDQLDHLRHTSDTASRSLYEAFNYREALRQADYVLGAFPMAADLSADELERVDHLRLTALQVRAVVLRDRNDRRAETEFDSAEPIAARVGGPGRVAELRRARITARLNRRAFRPAQEALDDLRRYAYVHGLSDLGNDFTRVAARVLEHDKAFDEAYVRAREIFVAGSEDPAWVAATHTMLGRLQAQIALRLGPRDRLAHQKLAFHHLEQARTRLSTVRQDVFSATMEGAWGFAFASVGDWKHARSRHDAAATTLQRAGLRNTAVEELYLALPTSLEDAEDSIAVAWARAAFNRRAAPAVAFYELYKGLELLLKTAASWDGREVALPLTRLVGSRLLREARLAVPEIETVLSDEEQQQLERLRRTRNVLAHQFVERDGAGHPIGWPVALRNLESAVRRIERAVPDQVLSAALPLFAPFRR